MPLVDHNDPAVWDSLYECRKGDGVDNTIYHYDRAVKHRILGNDHWLLRDALATKGFTTGLKICLIGGGFGWVAEDWAAAGYQPIIAVDTSTYIHSRKASEATVTIYDYDITTGSGRNDIKKALDVQGNNKVPWIITENVLPSITDAEAIQLDTFCRNIGDQVVHWVTVLGSGANQDVRLNWKTLAAWKLLLPLAWVVRCGSAEIL